MMLVRTKEPKHDSGGVGCDRLHRVCQHIIHCVRSFTWHLDLITEPDNVTVRVKSTSASQILTNTHYREHLYSCKAG
jgi:hypothetical protein